MLYLIGTGNYSMSDDSIGLRVVEHISQHNLEKGFEAIDLSGNSLNLLTYLSEETEKILIVDTLKSDHPEIKHPGDFVFFSLKDVETKKQTAGISTHEGDIIKTIELAKASGYFIPPVEFMGICPKTIKNEFGLSEELAAKLDLYCKEAISKLRP